MSDATSLFRSHPRRRRPTTTTSKASSARNDTARSRDSIAPRSNASVRSSVSRSTPAPRRTARQLPARSQRSVSVARSHHTAGSLRDQEAEEEQADHDADALGEIVMAVEMGQRGTLGCAYYVAQDEKLYFMEDMQLAGVESIDMLKLFINPTVVLLSSAAEDDVLNLLDPNVEARGSDGGSDPFSLPYNLELRPKFEFYYEPAKTKLANLRVGEQDGPIVSFIIPGDVHAHDDYEEDDYDSSGSGRQAQLLRFSGWISVDSQVTVGCAGAILCYLQKRRTSRFLPGDTAAQGYFRVSTIEMFSMKETMFVNADTLLSLQIIQSENHPNSHNQGPTKTASGAKEGLSLYGVFHGLAHTIQGRQMLRQCFLRPSTNMTLIKERLDTVTIFTRPDNEIGLEKICKFLRGVKNVRGLTAKLKRGAAGGTTKGGGIARSIWDGIMKFNYFAIQIYESLSHDMSGAERLTIFSKLHNKLDIFHLQSIGKMIECTIDFEQSKLENRTAVKPTVDLELDEKKRFYQGINALLSAVARDLAERIPAGLPNQLNVIYFPQIGYLIAMPMDPATGAGYWEGTEDEHWEKMFTSDRMVYYKTDQMTEMDSEFGDIYTEICDREIEIVHDLAQRVLVHEEMLNTISDIIGELDCLCALAQGARKYRLTRPRLTEQNIIQIEGGRHLLQELTVPAFIPNETYLVGGIGNQSDDRSLDSSQSHTTTQHVSGPSTIILTGPNYSGKSCYLKQVALVVYLAHIGSFVPATSATIGLTDKILTRISTRESVSRNQSAFMIDLQQMCMALNLATERSLVLIDEFSKGTNAVDGAGLACAVFEHLLALHEKAPKTLAATHFHEILENDLLTLPAGANPESLGFAHMDVRIDRSVANVKDQIAYLYTLKQGRSCESYGTICAALNGIDKEIVQRAKCLGEWAAKGEDMVAACALMAEEEQEELFEAERIARRFLEVDLSGDASGLLEEILATEVDMSGV